jgi:phospholipid N-methyltransferase
MSTNRSYLLDTEDALNRERKRLVVQAEVFSEFEFKVLSKIPKVSPRILDLGCGNGAYLSLLGKFLNSKSLVGYERNAALIDQSEAMFPGARIYRGDLLDSEYLKKVTRLVAADMVLARFVLQHLSTAERFQILQSILQSINEDAFVVLVESEDSKIFCSHHNSELTRLIVRSGEIQAKRGGNRDIGSTLSDEVYESGFELLVNELVYISTDDVDGNVFIPIISSIWRTCEDSAAKSEVDANVDSVESWMLKLLKDDRGFEFKFPIRIVIGMKRA